MPKRVIDYDAMWGSDKLAACANWAQAEYAWLYGLADACGCFEITNLRVIWGRVAAIRGNLTIERLEQVFDEFQAKGLLFVWECDGKQYAHWTGSDVPGRLPAPSWRMRLERFAPPVPKKQLEEYMARFARGRSARSGGGFRGDVAREAPISETARQLENGRLAFPEPEDRRELVSGAPGDGAEKARGGRAGGGGCDGVLDVGLNTGLHPGQKGGLEEAQEQNLNLGLNSDLNLNGNGKRDLEVNRNPRRGWAQSGQCDPENSRTDFSEFNSSQESNSNAEATNNSKAKTLVDQTTNAKPVGRGAASDLRVAADGEGQIDAREAAWARRNAHCEERRNRERSSGSMRGAPPRFGWSEKELATWREIWVGAGPVCTPRELRPAAAEGEKKRAASGGGGSGGGTS